MGCGSSSGAAAAGAGDADVTVTAGVQQPAPSPNSKPGARPDPEDIARRPSASERLPQGAPRDKFRVSKGGSQLFRSDVAE